MEQILLSNPSPLAACLAVWYDGGELLPVDVLEAEGTGLRDLWIALSDSDDLGHIFQGVGHDEFLAVVQEAASYRSLAGNPRRVALFFAGLAVAELAS